MFNENLFQCHCHFILISEILFYIILCPYVVWMLIAYNNSTVMKLPWRNSASEMYVNLNIYSLKEMLRRLKFRFMSRFNVSNNIFISNIYNSACSLYYKNWNCWDNFVHISGVNLWYTYTYFYVY